MSAPIIFCHYGNSEYLPYVFEAAKITNPDKDIFLLGDEENQWIGKAYGINHYFFRDFQYGKEIELFDQNYKLIQGKNHAWKKGGRDWVNFVFKRWFYIYNFLVEQKIDNFWHFDSDTMILNSLTYYEPNFRTYDCTEQCNGMCMNGFVSNSSIVLGYIRKINELFSNEKYLEKQQKEFDEVNPTYAFTEMRAYDIFKQEERIDSIRLNTIIDDSTFDDCICQEHNMEMEKLPLGQKINKGRKIKKVYLSPDRTFYCYEKTVNRLLRINSINLSWAPIYIFKIILLHLKKQTDTTDIREYTELDIRKMPTLSSSIPKIYVVEEKIKKIKRFVVKKLIKPYT
ncbi:MAG: hypothetical protein QNJ32_19430 [Xenococcaceae cyanobacterium MO_167.B27]|nr:hypothetical protein [Xenococcaceae cyanobacterium MO_167.B27]